MTNYNTQELDEIMDKIYDLAYEHLTARDIAIGTDRIKQSIIDWHNKQVEGARVEGAQHIFNMLEANVMLVDGDEISRRKLMSNMYEHLRLYAERNKLKESTNDQL